MDIDEQNKDNPLACSEYAENIFDYLNTCEVSTEPLTASSRVPSLVVPSAVQVYCLRNNVALACLAC